VETPRGRRPGQGLARCGAPAGAEAAAAPERRRCCARRRRCRRCTCSSRGRDGCHGLRLEQSRAGWFWVPAVMPVVWRAEAGANGQLPESMSDYSTLEPRQGSESLAAGLFLCPGKLRVTLCGSQLASCMCFEARAPEGTPCLCRRRTTESGYCFQRATGNKAFLSSADGGGSTVQGHAVTVEAVLFLLRRSRSGRSSR